MMDSEEHRKSYANVNRQEPKLPYPGLRPFKDYEWRIFFGRKAQTQEIISRLQKHHLAAVIGGSGCGKSSLVRAGVIPELRLKGLKEAGDTWLPIVFTPGKAPISNLAKQLNDSLIATSTTEENEQRISIIEDVLTWDEGFREFVDRFGDDFELGKGSQSVLSRLNLLILVDQFEEAFRPENRKNPQIDYLVKLIVDTYKRPQSHIYIVLTMRTEDMHQCAAYLELPDVLNAASYFTRRLNLNELKQAILDPPSFFAPDRSGESSSEIAAAHASTWPFRPEVYNLIFNDIASFSYDSDHLPLLQHLLSRLWEAACQRESDEARILCSETANPSVYGYETIDIPSTINIADLEVVVGEGHREISVILKRSLANHADRIYEQLPTDEHRSTADKMLKLLGEVDDNGVLTRRWTTRRDIFALTASTDNYGRTISAEKLTEDVIEAFTKLQQYIRTEGNGPDDHIDVSHESFIRQWPRFVSLLCKEREAARTLKDIIDHTGEVQRTNADGRQTWWKHLYARYFERLETRLLNKFAEAHPDALDKNKWGEQYQIWASRYLEEWNLEAEEYEDACDFYKTSVRRRWREKIFLVVLFSFVTVAVIVGQTERAKSQLAKKQVQWANLEAQAFHPYAIASTNNRSLEHENENAKPYRLLESALALRAVDQLHKELYPSQVNMAEVNTSEENESQTRVETAFRLAHEVSSQATRAALSSALWRVYHNGEELTDDSQLGLDSTPGIKSCYNALVKSRLRDNHLTYLSDAKKADRHDRLIIYNPDAGTVVFASGSGSQCTEIKVDKSFATSATKGEVVADKNMNLLILRYKSADKSTPEPFRAAIARLRWYKISKKDPPDEADGWRVDVESLGVLAFDKQKEFSIVNDGEAFYVKAKDGKIENKYRVVWDYGIKPINGSHLSQYFGNAQPKKRNYFVCNAESLNYEKGGSCESSDKQEIVNFSSNPEIISKVAEKKSLVAYIYSKSGKEKQNGKERTIAVSHVLKVLQSDERVLERGKNDDAFAAITYAITSLSFNASSIEDLAFGEGKEDGYILIKTKDGSHYRAAWSAAALLDVACGVLDELELDNENYLRLNLDSEYQSPAFRLLGHREGGPIAPYMGKPCD